VKLHGAASHVTYMTSCGNAAAETVSAVHADGRLVQETHALTDVPQFNLADSRHDERVDEAIADLLKTVDNSVPDCYRQQLALIMQKYRRLFSVDDCDVGLIPDM
jgi:hypothetical protein